MVEINEYVLYLVLMDLEILNMINVNSFMIGSKNISVENYNKFGLFN